MKHLLLSFLLVLTAGFAHAGDEPEALYEATVKAYDAKGALLATNIRDIEVYRINWRKKKEVIFDYNEKGILKDVIECDVKTNYNGANTIYTRKCDNETYGKMTCLGSNCTGVYDSEALSDTPGLVSASITEDKKSSQIIFQDPKTEIKKLHVVRIKQQ